MLYGFFLNKKLINKMILIEKKSLKDDMFYNLKGNVFHRLKSQNLFF